MTGNTSTGGRALLALALAAASLTGATLAGCSNGAGRAQEGETATVPSDREVVNTRADRARILGDTTAPVRVLEVSDFQCPYCQQFYRNTWPTIERDYVEAGYVEYVWLAFPNPNHGRAWPALEAAFCAGAVGKFWPMHDLLFENQAAWSEASEAIPLFVDYASGLGIERSSFRSCIAEDLPAARIIQDYGAVVQGGVSGTPHFVIDGSVSMQGAQPVERFRTVLDSLLQEKGVTPPGGSD